MNDHDSQTSNSSAGETNVNACIECERLFPQSDMVFLNKCWICAGCKPVFLQRLKENIGPEGMVGVLWRDGSKVVMQLGTVMPDRCLKCNAPGFGEKIKRQVQWHRPIYGAVLVVAVILIGATSAFISFPLFPIGFFLFLAISSNYFTKKVNLQMTLCRKHKTGRFIAIVVTASIFIVAILGLVCGIYFGMNWAVPALSITLLLAVIIYGQSKTRLLAPSKVTDDHVWLKGAGPEFLANLPEWPGTN